MILSFADKATSDVFDGEDSRAARKLLPSNLHSIARRKLSVLDFAKTLENLRIPPSNRLEALKGDRAGQYSIRINQQYRICFSWTDGDAFDVEIVDYH